MKRRDFNKIGLTGLVGTIIMPSITLPYQKENSKIRLGGPLFRKYKNPGQWIEALKELNYKAAYCPVSVGAGKEEIAAYKSEAKKADILIAEVGAWSNPIDPDNEKSRKAIEKCISSLQLADEIGANCCVNISGSRNPDKWAGPHKDNLTSDTFDLIVTTTRKIIDEVKPKSTVFALETMPWAYPDSVESYMKLIKAIDRKQFGVHFDPVNLVVSPQVYYKNGEMIKDAFKKLGKWIKSCHAKDILLLNDKLTPHLPEVRPGLGGIDFQLFLSELSKLNNVPLMMEHLNTAEEYFQAAEHIRSTGRGLF